MVSNVELYDDLMISMTRLRLAECPATHRSAGG